MNFFVADSGVLGVKPPSFLGKLFQFEVFKKKTQTTPS